MSHLRRLVLVRHGETDGASSVRYHGRGDVALSHEGRAQMRDLARRMLLEMEFFDAVVASPLQRAWESAWILSGGAPVRLDRDLREIDFGRWEGLTREEIVDSDPVLYAEWRSGGPDFRFPEGERRSDFRARVERALGRIRESGATNVLVVAHKGPVRIIAEALLGAALEDDGPGLGECVSVFRAPDGSWRRGRRSSNPGLLESAA